MKTNTATHKAEPQIRVNGDHAIRRLVCSCGLGTHWYSTASHEPDHSMFEHLRSVR